MLISFCEASFGWILLGEGRKGAWRRKSDICIGRAGRGVEEEAYFYRGWTGSGCGGGRGYFFGHSFGLEGWTFM